MNDDGTSGIGGDTDSINSKIGFILNRLGSQKNNEKDDPVYLKNLQDTLFPEEKENRTKFRRLKQKQKTLQAVPISIDSITSDGKRDIRKTLQDLFSFKMDVKKPDEKSGPWAKLFFILAFVVGFIIGAVLGFVEQVKKLFKFLEGTIKGFYGLIKDTKIGKFLRGLFAGLKAKVLKWAEAIRESSVVKAIKGFFNSVKETVLGWKAALKESKIYKAIESIFAGIKSRVGSIFNAIKTAFGKIKSFFQPVLGFLSKTKIAKLPTGALKGFMGFLSKLGGFFSIGLKVGKVFGRLFGPILALYEIGVGLFQAFSDPKLKDKSFLQKLITGVVKGILNFFNIFEIIGLNLITFDEVRDRIEKIFKPFREGKWLEGLGQILNQVVSFIVGLGGKVIGWLIGFFNKDLGDSIAKFSAEFDLVDLSKKAFNAVTDWVVGLWDKVVGFLQKLFGTVTDYVSWDNLKKLITLDWGNIGPKKKEEEPKKVGDFADTGDKMLFSEGQGYAFDKKDEILAMKDGGPIEKMLSDRSGMASGSFDELTKTVRDLGRTFEKYANTTIQIHTNEQKLMQQNIELLQKLGDKEKSSNVVVTNSSNNMVLQEQASSNLDYRREMTWLSRY